MTHRKAKGRSVVVPVQKQSMLSTHQHNDDLDEPLEFVESNSDPVWTPQGDDHVDDNPKRKSGRKSRSVVSKQQKRGAKSNILSVAAKGAGISDFCGSDLDDADWSNNQKNANNAQSYAATQVQPMSQSPTAFNDANSRIGQTAIVTSSQNYGLTPSDDFKSGDFVVSRLELFQDWPPIWRVDGKSLLQKFEPFHQNNKTIYRSITTYATWTPENRRLYLLAKCKYIGQFQHEVHVELLRDELCIDTSELYIEKMMQDALSYQDHFEVYIQTLISQALDSNFLTEIMQEQDEYFLSNVKTIDDLTLERKTRLLSTVTWSPRIIYSLEIWPCYNVINDLGMANISQIVCIACNQRGVASRIILYGQPYNRDTIESIQPDNRINFDKDLLLCRNCLTRCELFHKIAHQKYLMYIECARKVAEKNGQDPMKGTTVVLNELLADEIWLDQLFKNVRRSWAHVDQIERLARFSVR